PVGSADADGERPLDVLLCRNFIGTPAVLVRAPLLRAVGGFDERLPAFQDWDLWLRLARRTGFVHVPDVRTTSAAVSGISTDRDALVRAAARLTRKVLAWEGLDDRRRADLLAGVGNALIMSGCGRAGRGYIARAARLDAASMRVRALLWLARGGPAVYRSAVGLRRRATGRPAVERAVSWFWSLR
ncbi:MAG: hypothetical protein ACODAE_09900, partial [Gemmatimonadota bacterium]